MNPFAKLFVFRWGVAIGEEERYIVWKGILRDGLQVKEKGQSDKSTQDQQ